MIFWCNLKMFVESFSPNPFHRIPINVSREFRLCVRIVNIPVPLVFM